MQWQDEGIVIACKKLGESGLKVDLFTKQHGRSSGFVKASRSRKNKTPIDIGHLVQCTWKGRLREQLGQLQLEVTAQPASLVLHDAFRLSMVTSMCNLLSQVTAESIVETRLYERTFEISQNITQPVLELMSNYVRFEIELLAACGHPLDLSTCVATGKTESLYYVSPKSGCAVCQEAGAPLHDRLFLLPSFLLGWNATSPTMDQLEQAITITSHFLERVETDVLHKTIPHSRRELIQQFRKLAHSEDSLIGHNSKLGAN